MRLYKLFAAGILVFGTSCKEKTNPSSASQASKKQGPSTVQGYIVKTGAVSEPLELPGSLLPMEETELHSEVSGRVVGLYIK